MALAYRRVIRKPAGLSEDDAPRLAEQLAAALDIQQQLAARSLHVLQPVGQLQETDDAFLFEHEPATPLIADSLFDPSLDGADEPQLLRTAAALFDALKVALAGVDGRHLAHGSLCPGTLLVSPDGIEKTADFGIAPAICSVLGTDAYLNLALAVCPEPDGDAHVTGIWEILPPDEFERDDRICAFIDPEKYGTQLLAGFEAGSDVIGAGFVLHLLAEHQHPYLHADPDAHRIVEMAEYMAMGRYNGARRQDLRESDNPAVQLWCTLVAKALSRLPQERPTAADISEQLSQHVRPVDAGEILRRRLESAAALAEQGAWEEMRQQAKAIADSEAAPPDVAQRAGEMLRQADAQILLGRVTELMAGDQWSEAAEPLERVIALPALPEDVAERATKAQGVLRHNLAVAEQLQALEPEGTANLAEDPVAAHSQLDAIWTRLEDLPPLESLLPPLQSRVEAYRNEVADRREQAAAAASQVMAADHERADHWIKTVDSLVTEHRWDEAQRQLTERPELRYWPEQANERAEQLTHQITQARADAQQKAAIEADAQRAEEWITEVRDAVESQSWGRAQQQLDDRPQLDHWPKETQAEAESLANLVARTRREQTDFEAARRWIERIREVIEQEEWSAAADALAQKPDLESWPDEVVEEESLYRDEVTKQLDAIELDRRRIEEENTRARHWVEKARTSADENDWEDVLTVLENPPEIGQFPEEVVELAQDLKRRSQDALGQAALDKLLTRTQTTRRLATAFVRQVVEQDLASLLSPELVKVAIDAEELISDHPQADGRADLLVTVPGLMSAEEEGIRCRFDFQIDAQPSRVFDDEGSIRANIGDGLKQCLGELQKTRAGEHFRALREGLFPKAKVRLKLDGPTARATVVADLLGSGSPESTLGTDIEWDPANLQWRYVSPDQFAGQAAQIVVREARPLVSAAVLEQAKPFRPYRSILAVEVAAPANLAPDDLANGITLEGRLTLQPGQGERQLLQTVAVTCSKLGQANIDDDLTPAQARLGEVIAGAQRQSRDALAAELGARLAGAPAKVKISLQPRQISTPTDEIQFDLKARKHEPASLKATWDLAAFAYRPASGWEDRLSQWLATAEVPEKPRRSVALPAAVAAAVLVVAVTAGVIFFGGRDKQDDPLVRGPQPSQPDDQAPPLTVSGETPPDPAAPGTEAGNNDPTPGGEAQPPDTTATVDPPPPLDDQQGEQPPTGSTNGAATETPPDQPLPSLASALAQVRAPLLASGYFSEADLDRWLQANEDDPQHPTVQYRLPGLADSVRTVAFEPSADGSAWSDIDTGLAHLSDGLAELAELLTLPEGDIPLDDEDLDLASIASGVEPVTSAGWLSRERLAVRLPAAPRWRATERGLEADAATVELVFTPSSGDQATVLASSAVGLRAVDGSLEVTLADEAQRMLGQQVSDAVVARQNDALTRLTGQVRTEAADIGTQITADPTTITSPQAEVTLTARAASVADRVIPLAWDSDELTYAAATEDEAGWRSTAQEMIQAARILSALNDRANPERDWLGRGSRGPVIESGKPDSDGVWTLMAPAPWAPPGTATAQLPDADRLMLQVDWPGTTTGADEAARSILDSGEPDYWALFDQYRAITTDPMFLLEVATASPESTGVVGYLKSDPLLAPAIAPSGKPAVLTDENTGTPAGLSVTFQPTWTIRQAPNGVDRAAINSALRQLGQAGSQTLTLTLAADGQIEYTDLAGAVSGLAPSLGRIQALDARLRLLADRARVETAVGAALGGGGSTTLTATQALQLLRDIWRAKGVTPTMDAGSLDALVSDAQRQVRFSKAARATRPGLLHPSVFVEFFCGPQSTYALAWSVKHELADPAQLSIDEGPVLLRLGATAALTPANLGDTVLTPVFSQVSAAIETDAVVAHQAQLGLVLALDDPLWAYSRQFEQARLVQQKSSLKRLDRPGNPAQAKRWSSLAQLRDGPQRSDYIFVTALSASDRPDDDAQWAMQTLAGAM